MLNDIGFKGILFLDVETVPQEPGFNDLGKHWQELWARKMRFTVERENKSPQELYERAGIYAEFGKIICISTGYIHNKKFVENSFYGHEEKDILMRFSEFISGAGKQAGGGVAFNTLCAHNGKEFDFPYISRRCLINGLRIPDLLDNSGKKPWEISLLDTMDMWKFGDFKSYTSLDLLAASFGIPSPKDQMDGSEVWKVYWKENNLEKIKTYCEKDVRTVAKLYLKFLYPGLNFDSAF